MSSHRASSSSSTPAEKAGPSSHPNPSKSTHPRVMRHVPWAQHTFRQLKLLVPGAAVTYYLHTLDEFWDVLHGSGGSWAQSVSTSLVYLLANAYFPFASSPAYIHADASTLSRSAAAASSILGLTTIILFLYVLFLPLITGEEPNVCEPLSAWVSFTSILPQYRTWRESRTLVSVIPVSYTFVSHLSLIVDPL